MNTVNAIKRLFSLLLITLPVLAFPQNLNLKEIKALNASAWEQMKHSNRLDTAYTLAMQAYRSAQDRFPTEAAKSMIPMGRYLELKFQLDTSIQMLTAAKKKLVAEGLLVEASYASCYLAIAFFLQQKTSLAIKHFEEAKSLMGMDQYLAKNVYNGLAYSHYWAGNYIQSLENAQKYLQASTSRVDTIRALTRISNVYSKLQDGAKGQIYARKAKRLINPKTDGFLITDLYESFIAAFQAANQLDSALFYTEEIIGKTPFDKSHTAHLQLKKGMLLHDLNQFDDAVETYLNALSALSNSTFEIITEQFHRELSESYISLNSYDSALHHAHLYFKLSKEKQSLSDIATASKMLADVFTVKNKKDSALKYLQLSYVYKDSIFNDENEKKFADLRVEVETLEKQREIDQLTAQKEIDSFRQKQQILGLALAITLLIGIILTLIYRAKNAKKRQTISKLRLQQELQQKETELQQQTLHMINLSNNMADVEQKLKEVKKKANPSKQDVQKVLSNISVKKSMGEEWNRFESYFSNIHTAFGEELLAKHSNLSRQERRLIALIKMDLSNREIANLFNIEPRSVSMNKYRLKQKLGLTENDDLEDYINQIFGDRKK